MEQRLPLVLWSIILPHYCIISHLSHLLMTYTWFLHLLQPLAYSISGLLWVSFPTSMYPPHPSTQVNRPLQTVTSRTPKLPQVSHRVQHEAVDAIHHGQDQHSGTAVQGIASSYQVPAGLQSILLRRLIS